MDAELWRRAKQLYFAVSGLDTAARAAHLDRECAGNPELRHEVDRLFSADSSHGILAEPLVTRPLEGFAPGARLAHFVIEAQIGKGGGGLVYRAIDTKLNRPIAIKILRDANVDADKRRRFAREAEAASALNHPNIVTVYETGVENGRDFIAMEYVQGYTLHEAIGGKPVPLAKALRLAIQIADAVHAAHQAGIVHRDLKPGNVMITERGQAKVLDFGLAKTAPNVRAETAGFTAAGTLVGTFAYMAPEQAEGKPADKRCDIFSFGCILYEMLTGRRAFQAESEIRSLAAVLNLEPAPIRELAAGTPREIERLVNGCLRKDPVERWQDLGDVKILLDQVQKDVESGALFHVPASIPRRRAILPITAALLAGAALAGLASWYWIAAKNRPGPEPRLTMLTADTGLSAYPALSRDGAILAYASDRASEGNLDIWVQQIGGRESIRITTWDSDETDPDLSPDGTQIAFRSEREGGGIYVVSTFGGEPVLLAPQGRDPHFSPDGKQIAFWVGREGPGYTSDSAHSYIVPRGGGERRLADGGMSASLYPIWSPDGQYLMMLGSKDRVRADRPAVDWWIVPAAGGAPRQTGSLATIETAVKVPYGQFRPQPMIWLDSPSRVLFSGRLGDTTNIWEFVLASREIKRITTGTAYEVQAALGSAGGKTRFAYSSLTLDFDIWALPINLDLGKPAGDLRRITTDASSETSPSLSRDGGLLAFTSQRSDTWSIRTVEFPSNRRRLLTDSLALIKSPLISGDGAQIVYRAEGIMAVSSQGGAPRTICTKCGTATDPGEDGSRILAEPMKGADLVLVADSGEAISLVSGEERLAKGRWSIDGKWVAFQALTGKDGDNVRIYAARVTPGVAVRRQDWVAVTDGESDDKWPAWSPNGNILYFLSERDGSTCIWAQRLDPGSKAPSGEAFGVQHFHGARKSFRWHGNSTSAIGLAVGGNLAVFSLGELKGNIWLRD